MSISRYDNLTIDRFRSEPRFSNKDFEDGPIDEQTTPRLWKDLTLASIVATLLWIAAAVFA